MKNTLTKFSIISDSILIDQNFLTLEGKIVINTSNLIFND